MPKKKSVYEYLSIELDGENGLLIDGNSIEYIRDQFQLMTTDKTSKEAYKNLAKELDIKDDKINLELLQVCVQEESIDNAKAEIGKQYYEQLEDQTTPPRHQVKKSSEQITTTDAVENIKEINCQIDVKANHKELENFFQDFLLKSLDQNKSTPTKFNTICLLNSRCILDLFIRKQMQQQGIIDYGRERSKIRLVEPISLVDEFDTWVFDHFHCLFDIFLTRPNKQTFPLRWQLVDQAKITYEILSIYEKSNLLNGEKQIERPSTESLEKFIEGICRIEDNGMTKQWIDLLRKEDITTYAHLTNLNQKEWESIKQLSMNALKTIKMYIDREKQTSEDTTTTIKSTKDKNESESEMLAKIHMIKLFFNHALKTVNGITHLPKLDSRCVDQSFEEMRKDYEDDGLFDEMIEFFLPLTVNERELIFDAKEISMNRDGKLARQNQYERDMKILVQENRNKKRLMEAHQNEINQLIQDRERSSQELDAKLQKLKHQNTPNYIINKNDLEKQWSIDDNRKSEQIRKLKKSIQRLEYQYQDCEALIKDKQILLKTVVNDLNNQQTSLNEKLVKPHRGFIMYGPPGTGKSHIMSQLAKKIGIAMLGPPLAAGELERPYVGQSEAVILDLCSRANRLPYLMCCVSIDEIDSLAPRRDEDSSEGKVAKISVLLSVLEGIKDVPNLMFFSATNRLHMMDEAFLRRMSGKFFVGRPSSQARKRILNNIPGHMLEPSLKEKLAIATTNFSGAALSAFNRSLVVNFLSKRRSNGTYKIEYKEVLILADRTARQYQIYLGLDTLPRLLKRNEDSKKNSTENIYHLNENYNYTGKLIISLFDRLVRVEYMDYKEQCRKVFTENLNDNEENLQQLLERITNYGNDRNVQLLQLIDLNLFSSKGAYDEKKIFEILKERYDECMEYKRSMIIYDLDSLIGVNESESESSMGTSTSSSIVNQSLYIYVTSRFREAVIETDEKINIEKWSIAVVRDAFLMKKFCKDVQFPKTERERDEEDEQEKKENELIKCIKCRDHFLEHENKMGNCTYHDGFVYDNFSLDLKKYTATKASTILSLEECEAFQNPEKKDNIERQKGRFKYICCDSNVQSSAGCKKGKHALSELMSQSREKHILTREAIDEWESFCMENDEYNERWYQLLQSRSKGNF